MMAPGLVLVVNALVNLSVLAVAGAVIYDFKRYHSTRRTKASRHSAVATGTMTLFFVGYYLVLRMQWGAAYPESLAVRWGMIALGLLGVVGGAAVNLWGRVVLGRNWANHIKIYDDHTLVTAGPFRYIRHPLYSSLFWMFFGGALIFSNWLGAALTAAIFVPMMNYRAAQEEVLLRQTFPAYDEYCRMAGRFLPKSVTGYQKGANHV